MEKDRTPNNLLTFRIKITYKKVNYLYNNCFTSFDIKVKTIQKFTLTYNNLFYKLHQIKI